MRALSKYCPFWFAPNGARPIKSGQSGSVMVYVIVVILIFGFLGAGMISMYTSSTKMSSRVPNHARNAEYLAEAGLRYAVSELRNKGYTKEVISTLNTTTYTVNDAGSFTINVFGKWFQPTADYNASSGTLSLDVPQGQFPSSTITDFDIPVGAYVVNLEGYRDAWIYSATPGPTSANFAAQVQSVVYSSINIGLTDQFQATTDNTICLAIEADGDQTDPDKINIPLDAEGFFPAKYGSFYVTSTIDEQTLYHYEEMTNLGTYMQLSGLRSSGVALGSTIVLDGDLVILSPHNHTIAAAGSASSSVSGGENFYAASYRQNIETPETTGSPVADTVDDVETDTIIGEMDTPAESNPGAVDVDTGTGEITLGGGVASAFGSVFFGGDVSFGGASICSGGECVFKKGVRAFFVLDYTGTGPAGGGDGFTFALINGTDNSVGATGGGGGSGELLGYAGAGGAIGSGLAPPKMALEFDTYVNSSRNDPDLGTSNRDVLQYVYWGDGQADLFDDNTHDTGGSGQKWSPYLPASHDGDIETKPVLNSAETSLYFTSKNGYIHEVDPDTGIPNTGTSFPQYLEDDSYSSPALDSRGYIFNPGDNNYINVFTPTGSWDWYNNVGRNVRSSPVIDSNDVVYFGDDDGDFYAFDSICPSPPSGCPRKWNNYGVSATVNGTPALSPDEATVYFASTSSERIYALDTSDGSLPPNGAFEWSKDLLGPIYSSPTVAADGTIYIGSDGGSGVGYLYALNPNGSEKWRYTFTPTNPHCTPTIGPDGTIYIGNNDNYLYAITDDETTGTLKWRFQTGGDVHSQPLVHDDGTIWFGSDDNYLYVIDSNGQQIDRFYLYGDVKSAPIQGSDGAVYVGSNDNKLYAYKPTCNPQNIETRVFSYDNLLAGEAVEDLGDITDSDNWLNSGPWAVRVEVERSETANSRGLYEYNLKTWIRQCQQADCTDITASYFADTRIAYGSKDPHLTQKAELCSAEHNKFDTFLYGFTQATGGATQTAIISNVGLGFIRDGDFVITDDPNWQ